MSAQTTARSISLAALFALLGAGACSEDNATAPLRPAAPHQAKRDISVSNSAIVLLSIEVSVPRSKQPLIYNLPIADGKGADALATPAGEGRRLVVRGFDAYGNTTHQGTIEWANIRYGVNEPLSVTLLPVGEGKEAQVRFDVVGEEPSGGGTIIFEGGEGELNEGGTSSAVRAYVLDRNGRRIDINPRDIHWAVSDPKLARAKADDRGTAYMTALHAGYAELIATWKDIIAKHPWNFIYDPYVQITAGREFTCGRRSSGVVACWGDNVELQLGATSSTLSCSSQCNDRPVLVSGNRKFSFISAGAKFVCGIETGGLTSCWGMNDKAQLGNGMTGNSIPSPSYVNTTLKFLTITTGGDHACGIVNSTNREAMCWGWNNIGQIGDGNPGFYSFNPMQAVNPVLVLGGHHWLSIAAGKEHTCGVTTTNRALCWGSNYYNEIGIGPFLSVRDRPDTVNTPINPPMQSAFASANGYTTCWLRTGPIGLCNGSNDSGQAGIGGSSQSVGQPVGLWANPPLVTMAVGGKHVCGLDGSDNLWCWGSNYYGQIANTAYYFLNHPLQPGAYKYGSVAAGNQHTCGLTRGGDVYCWGRNNRGQLGIGSVGGWTLTPTLVLP